MDELSATILSLEAALSDERSRIGELTAELSARGTQLSELESELVSRDEIISRESNLRILKSLEVEERSAVQSPRGSGPALSDEKAEGMIRSHQVG